MLDKQLVDNLLKVILDDKEKKSNTYNHLDSLLLTLSDEELDYFLEQCDENVFSNYDLFLVLTTVIPKKMKNFVEEFVRKKLYIINLMEQSLKNEYTHGRISKELYDETIAEYEEVRKEGDRFLNLYLAEIDKELKKQ
jgi:hypothetical protein